MWKFSTRLTCIVNRLSVYNLQCPRHVGQTYIGVKPTKVYLICKHGKWLTFVFYKTLSLAYLDDIHYQLVSLRLDNLKKMIVHYCTLKFGTVLHIMLYASPLIHWKNSWMKPFAQSHNPVELQTNGVRHCNSLWLQTSLKPGAKRKRSHFILTLSKNCPYFVSTALEIIPNRQVPVNTVSSMKFGAHWQVLLTEQIAFGMSTHVKLSEHCWPRTAMDTCGPIPPELVITENQICIKCNEIHAHSAWSYRRFVMDLAAERLQVPLDFAEGIEESWTAAQVRWIGRWRRS